MRINGKVLVFVGLMVMVLFTVELWGAIIELQVGASSDDCFRRLHGDYLGLTMNSRVGDASSPSAYDFRTGVRFVGVNIPQGTPITAAYLSFKATSMGATIPITYIEGENADNANTFSINTDYDSRVRTSASVTWIPSTWVSGNWYNSTNISTVIQEIVNRPGWVSGNAIVLFWRDAPGFSGANNYVFASSFDDGGAAAPKLYIYYDSEPAVTTNDASNIGETSARTGGDITDTGGMNCNRRGVQYGTSSGSYPLSSYEDGTFGTGSYNRDLTGLSRGTRYFFRAFAENSIGTGYGSEKQFLTKPAVPSGFIATAGLVSGRISLSWIKGDGAQNTYIRGKIGSYPTSRSDGALVYNNTGTSFDHNGLTGGAVWYYRAWSYVTVGGLEQYSDDYDEDYETTITYPTASTLPATVITHNSATLNGEIDDDGGAVCQTRFRWRVNGIGVWIETDWQPIPPPLVTDDTYFETITDLIQDTQYEFQTQASNSLDEGSWSSSETFTTLAPTYITITVDWNNGNVQTITLQDNVAFTFEHGQPGGIYHLILKQDEVGGHIINWDTIIKWPSGIPPSYSIESEKTDVIKFICDGVNYLGFLISDY